MNSWRLTLAEVSTPEMIEVQLVNSVAPFILCAWLKPLMLRAPGETRTAKAALNMLTLTAARDYVRDGIHMNAVDTGWIADEDPFVHATRSATSSASSLARHRGPASASRAGRS